MTKLTTIIKSQKTSSGSGDSSPGKDFGVFEDVSSAGEDEISLEISPTLNSSVDSMDSTSKKMESTIHTNMKVSSYDDFDPELEGNPHTGDMDEIIGMLNKTRSVDSYGDLSGYYSARSSSDDDSELYEHLFANNEVKRGDSCNASSTHTGTRKPMIIPASKNTAKETEKTLHPHPSPKATLLIEKITDLHASSSKNRDKNNKNKGIDNAEVEDVDEWEDDDDSGYLIIPLTNDEFFELEEAATQALLRAEASKVEEEDEEEEVTPRLASSTSKNNLMHKRAGREPVTCASSITAAHERGVESSLVSLASDAFLGSQAHSLPDMDDLSSHPDGFSSSVFEVRVMHVL